MVELYEEYLSQSNSNNALSHDNSHDDTDIDYSGGHSDHSDHTDVDCDPSGW